MTPKELLLAAAKKLEDGEETFACIALKDAAGFYDKPYRTEHFSAHGKASVKFAEMHQPNSLPDNGGGGWWPMNDEGRAARVIALLATAATFN